ncbi:MAG: hypothetical protein JW881_20625 [Spirochaetales bacterium]|nr:hypothetical protein [Spirochaetales bacterium]
MEHSVYYHIEKIGGTNGPVRGNVALPGKTALCVLFSAIFTQLCFSCLYTPQYPVTPRFDTAVGDPFGIETREDEYLGNQQYYMIRVGSYVVDTNNNTVDVFGVANREFIYYINKSEKYNLFDYMTVRLTVPITGIDAVRDFIAVDILGGGEGRNNAFLSVWGNDADGDGNYETYGDVYFIRTFADISDINTGGNAFNLTAGDSNGAPTLAFVDIDDDEDFDAFVGSDHGNIFFFENVGTRKKPDFANYATNPFNIVNAGRYSVPAFADIDEDHDYDLFVGVVSGDVVYFENTGDRVTPVFSEPEPNPFGIESAASFASPFFYDIDEDGDMDLYLGYSDGILGRTLFYGNISY